VVGFTLRPLYGQVKSPWYPLDRRLGGPTAGMDVVVKRKIPSPCWSSNLRSSSSYSSAIPLSYTGSSSIGAPLEKAAYSYYSTEMKLIKFVNT
jgi:hypothetical protein